MILLHELERLEREGRRIRVAIAGTGQMGTDLVCQITTMKGMVPSVVAELDFERARRAFLRAGVPEELIERCNSLGEIEDAARRGKSVIVEDISLLSRIESVDVVVDATGIPEVGARLAWECILGAKHIVMLNVEADVTVGAILNHLAEKTSVVYTGSAGDEPAATLELVQFARTLGFEVVAAGKGKNNPLDRSATPDSLKATADSQEMGAKMLTSFVDGTKTMVEMTALSNATGLVPDIPGMHGPVVKDFHDLADVFATSDEGGVLSRRGVVDYALGNVAPGVFVVFRATSERVEKSLRYSKMGPGPNHVLYRPYHLISLETPLSVARAYLAHEATIVTAKEPISETTAVAKRNLRKGEIIDGIGGECVYGSIDTVGGARSRGCVPIGLVARARVKRDVSAHELLTYDMIEIDTTSAIFHLRKLQEEYFRQ
jgi:predicted homoserine dehydrogenase-like protein